MRRPLLVLTIALAVIPSARAWSWPADGPVLQRFSFDSTHPYAGGQHRGIDVGGGTGDTVRAPAAGIVTFAGVVPDGGKTLSIETADGWSVTLVHSARSP
jgi:lipoprotein NlpD